MNKEIKSLKQYQTDIDVENKIITGFPSIMGVCDDGNDLITNGAFSKTVTERRDRIKWLWYHNLYSTDPPIAKILEIGEVGRNELPAKVIERYPNATGGLKVTRQYLDTPKANEIFECIKTGVIDEMSIGFDIIQAEYPEDFFANDKQVRRVIKEVRLWEMSDLLFGMNPATTNTKSLDLVVSKFLKTGNLEDSEFKFLENVFSENKQQAINLFMEIFGTDFNLSPVSDTIEKEDLEKIKNSKNASEMLAKILEYEIDLL